MKDSSEVRILLVENDLLSRKAIAELLKTADCFSARMSYAINLEEAAQRLRWERYDVVLLDLELPDCAGWEGLTRISSMDRTMPVILLTSRKNHDLGLEALHQQASDYLVKSELDQNLLTRSIRYSIERKKAARQVEDSRMELSTMIDNLPLAIFLVDGERRIRKANQVASDFVGSAIRKAIECRAGDALGCVHALETETGCGFSEACACCPLKQAIAETFERGVNHQNIELKMVLKRNRHMGEWIFLASSSRVNFGEEALVLLCVQDITERKRAEEDLKKQHSLLNTLITNTEDLIYIKGKDSRFLLANLATARHMGVESQDALVGKTDFDYFPRDLASLFYADEQKVIETGEPLINKEEPAIGINGLPMVVSTTKVPIRDAQGAVAGLIGIGRDITDRKKAEEALRVSEERYRTLVEMSPEPVFLNQDNRIVFVNSAAIKFFGATTPEDLIGRSPFDLFDDDYHADMGDRIGKLLSGQTVPAVENVAKRLDGSRVFVEIVAASLSYKDKRVIQVLIRDIHERKLREAELLRLNRTLKALSDSNQALARAESESEFLQEICRIIVEDCNHSMVWIGMALDDAAKTVRPVAQAGFEDGYLDILNISWADIDRGRGPTGTAIRTGKVSVCGNMQTDPRFQPWRAEAVKRGYRSSVCLPLMREGRAFGSLTIYSRHENVFIESELQTLGELAKDLSYGIHAIRLRQERDKALADLRESESRLILAQQAANAGTWEWNLKTNENVLSDESWRIFGLDPTDDLSTPRSWTQIVHLEDLSSLEDQIQKAASKAEEVNLEWKIASNGQPERWVMLRGRPIEGPRGLVERYTGIIIDITERKRVEDILKRDNETLEALVSQKTQELLYLQQEAQKAKRLADIGMLSATVAHELRNPLATIRVAAFNLLRKNKDAEIAKRMKVIDQSVEDSNQIINNLLFFSRIKTPHYEEVDLALLIDQLVENYKSLPGIKLKVQHPPELRIRCDKLQAKELFSNLLNNACDAVSGKKGVIQVTADILGTCLEVQIRDNGIGISQENLKDVWEPFFSTKAKGTGLGMTVCRQVVQLHNGTIDIESKEGEGTVVHVRLPLNRQVSMREVLYEKKSAHH